MATIRANGPSVSAEDLHSDECGPNLLLQLGADLRHPVVLPGVCRDLSKKDAFVRGRELALASWNDVTARELLHHAPHDQDGWMCGRAILLGNYGPDLSSARRLMRRSTRMMPSA